MKKIILSTKSKTLESLKGLLKNAEVLPQYCFKIKDWNKNNDRIINNINSVFQKTLPKIVRSSAKKEDSLFSSLAGHFTSELNIIGDKKLSTAITNVIHSYGNSPKESEEVFVQPMLKQTTMSGVAFSHDPVTGSAYKVISYSEGENTSSVTSGLGNSKTFIYFNRKNKIKKKLKKIIELLDELELIFPNIPLDIEFAFSKNKLFLFQVRALIINKKIYDKESHRKLLDNIKKKINEGKKKHPFLYGKSNLYGVMPDWNPAEIIGVKPRPLALSLYKELITDSIWAYQRNNYGYINLRSFPLMVDFGGQPYIDVRLSFNSFIPKDIQPSLANRLVNYYIDKLKSLPKLHDKIEYEIVFSCYTFDLYSRLKQLKSSNFNSNDINKIYSSLKNLTMKIIDPINGLWLEDQKKILKLESRRNKINLSNLNIPSKIYWLLEDCKRYGTLPFAGLARAGFIAVQILKSLISTNIFNQNDFESFMYSLNTVGKELANDKKILSTKKFIKKYGHLRPGTYDITSERYDEAPKKYFGNKVSNNSSYKKPKFTLTNDQKIKINLLLKEHDFSIDLESLLHFIKSAIELRELAKFEFTKNLSDALKLFNQWGKGLGFSTDDLSYSNINSIKELYVCSRNEKEIISDSIMQGKKAYEHTKKLRLPSIIVEPEDVNSFHLHDSEPNFITQNTVSGKVVLSGDKEELSGNIVFIESADPGYDWLFTYPIAGLVTAYGGVNSHMAIRANELELPAVIGVGEELFNNLIKKQKIHIDCLAQKIEVIS